MKPKTKLHKKIVKLSDSLIPITEEQKRWAEQKCYRKYFVKSRKSHYCLECGEKWKPDEQKLSSSTTRCPSCEEKLQHYDDWERDASIYEYWAILSVVEGYQVVRMFRSHKYLKKKQPVTYYHQEVMQHWVGKGGKITTLSARCQGMGHYYDQWVSGTDLEVRTKSHNSIMRRRISPYKICPGRKILPVIRRNGYKGYFYNEAPHLLFSAILKHQKAETLLKSGQIELFRYYTGLDDDTCEVIDKHWDSICIAMRNDYIVDEAGDWIDYLGMLNEFGKDLHNAHYVCPTDFHSEHQRYVKKRTIKRKAEAKEKRRKRIEEAEKEYLKAKSKYFDFKVVTGDLHIMTMKSVKDVIELGDSLHHCLDMGYAKKENSLILGAYVDGEPVEAIEVNLKQMEIIQSRGLQNKATDHHDQIVEAVRQNMSKIAGRKEYKEVA